MQKLECVQSYNIEAKIRVLLPQTLSRKVIFDMG
jgi:hypothetical protein